MAMRGKAITLYLMDGDPSGRIKCTLTNWTGVAYKISRVEAKNGVFKYAVVTVTGGV